MCIMKENIFAFDFFVNLCDFYTVCEPNALLQVPVSLWQMLVLFDIQLSVWNIAMLTGSEPLLGRTSLCGSCAKSAAKSIKSIRQNGKNTAQTQNQFWYTWIKMAASLILINSLLCIWARNQRCKKMILSMTSLWRMSWSFCLSSSLRYTCRKGTIPEITVKKTRTRKIVD